MDFVPRKVRPIFPRLLTKVSTADAGFLMWLGKKEAAMDVKDAKKEYLLGINLKRMEVYDKQMRNTMTILMRRRSARLKRTPWKLPPRILEKRQKTILL